MYIKERYTIERDPKHEVGWALVKRGKWLNSDFATKTFKCGADHDRAAGNQERLFMEASLLVDLQHLHDVRLDGFGQFEQQSIFVMELMTTDHRRSMTNKPQPLTGSEKIDIIIEIAKGMIYIYSKGCAHGDLKCSSIVVSIWK